MPLSLSDLLLNNSAVTNIRVDITIKHVATAIIVGLNCSLNPTHIWIGIVVFSNPAKNSTTTTSSNDVTNANKAPDITPGIISGNVIFINVFTGLLPKLAAALVTLWSKPDKVAVTVITTNGVPKIIWDRTIPVWVAAKPTFAIKKKIAVPDIIRGTIIGEINKAIKAALYGMCLLLKPKAATVPRIVDPIVAKKAIIKLFFVASPHGFFVPKIISSYHLKENPSGSSANIFAEKWMYCSALNESGKITNNGAIKKKNTKKQKVKYV